MSKCSTQQNLTVPQVDGPDKLILIEASHYTTQPIPDPISTYIPVPVSNTSTITSSPTTQLHLSYNVSHLPKLNVPFYTANPLLWQSFWNCFNAAINLNSILAGGVQKLTYLRAQLQGDAAGVIRSWIIPYQCQLQSFDNSCTELLWSTLQASQCSCAGSFRLIPSPTNTLTSLQQSHDLVDSHIRSLSSLEKDRESGLYSILQARNQGGSRDSDEPSILTSFLLEPAICITT